VIHDGKVLMTGTAAELKKNYMKDKKIEIKTISEDYSELKENIIKQGLDIKEIKEEGKRLTVKTEDVVSALTYIINTLKKSKDELSDISIERPTLNEVFEDMMKKEAKDGSS
jgi:ABC-type multidrug transport system ATPase subunit